MINLCCFADERMSIAQDALVNSFNFKGGYPQNTFIYQKFKLGEQPFWTGFDDKFLTKNKEILGKERGCGYWLWKPYIISQTLKKIPERSWLLYLDSGIEIVENIAALEQYLIGFRENIVVFKNSWSHMDWCKMDVLQEMLPDFNDRSYKQMQASAIFIRNTEENRYFVNDWLHYSCIPHFIDDSPSVLLNVNTFREHRHDQAILTNLVIKKETPYGLDWDAHITYNKNNLNRKSPSCPILFYHHRKRNDEWKSQQ